MTSRTEEDESNQDNHPSFEIGFSVDEDGNILKSLWQACKNAELAQSQEPKAVRSLKNSWISTMEKGREEALLMGTLAEKFKHQMEFIQYFLDIYDIGPNLLADTEVNQRSAKSVSSPEANFIEH